DRQARRRKCLCSLTARLRLMLSQEMTSAQERKIRQTGCDARFDNLTRQLYSTDASIYQIHPVGAAFPKTAEQASLVIHATADAGLSITPRGAGTRCPIYGTTADHVLSLEIVLADGRLEKIGASHESLVREQAKIEKLVRAASTEMAERWPPGLIKRWPGYGIERFLRVPNDLTH